MNTLNRPVVQRNHVAGLLRERRGWKSRGTLQMAIGVPLALFVIVALLLLAMPDLLKSKAYCWERYGEH